MKFLVVRVPQPTMIGAGSDGVCISEKPFKGMLRLRRMDMERYRPDRQYRRDKERGVPVVSFRQRTYLFGVLIVLCQFAMVDNLLFLPTGTILYALGIAVVIEIFQEQDISVNMPWGHDAFAYQSSFKEERKLGFTVATDHDHDKEKGYDDHDDDEELRQKLWQKHYELASFEYHILKGRPNTKLITRKENGNLVLYSI